MSGLPFDKIVLVEHGGSRWITLDELNALRIHDRISAILEDRLEFYLDGERVEVNIALRALRMYAAKSSATDVDP